MARAFKEDIGGGGYDAQEHLESQILDALKRYPQKLMPEYLVPTFQDFARRAAKIVEERGFGNVSPLLQKIAQNVRDIGEKGWDDPIRLGQAFRRAVNPQPEKGNPFTKMKLG